MSANTLQLNHLLRLMDDPEAEQRLRKNWRLHLSGDLAFPKVEERSRALFPAGTDTQAESALDQSVS